MKKRLLKKKNKKQLSSILNSINKFYKVQDIKYGDGYFMFSFGANSVCHFSLEEFPDWRFGIWLNRNELFGQTLSTIDKFKPCRSPLSETDITSFIKELNKIKNNHSDWKEYLEETERCKLQEQKSKEYNNRQYKKIFEYVQETKKQFNNGEVASYLVLKDRNTKFYKSYPRYMIEEYADTEEYFDTEEANQRTINLFIDLCSLIEYLPNYNDNIKEYINEDNYIFEPFSSLVEKPENYEEKMKWYGHEEKTFEKHIEKVTKDLK